METNNPLQHIPSLTKRTNSHFYDWPFHKSWFDLIFKLHFNKCDYCFPFNTNTTITLIIQCKLIQFSIQGRIGFSIRYGSIHLGSGGVFLFQLFFYSSLRSLSDPERAVILAGPTIIVGVVTSTGKLFLITIPSISSTNPCSRRRGSRKCKTHAFVHVQNESGMRGVELFFQQAPPVSVYNASL